MKAVSALIAGSMLAASTGAIAAQASPAVTSSPAAKLSLGARLGAKSGQKNGQFGEGAGGVAALAILAGVAAIVVVGLTQDDNKSASN